MADTDTYYGSVQGYKDYHSARDNDIPVQTDDEIEAELLRSSEWLDNRYRAQFGGLKVGMRAQIREWPRYGVIDFYGYAVPSDSVPREIENATYEAAAKDAASPGILSVDWTPGKYDNVSIDGAISVKYRSFSSASDIQTQFTVIDEILSSLIGGLNADFSPMSGATSRV